MAAKVGQDLGIVITLLTIGYLLDNYDLLEI